MITMHGSVVGEAPSVTLYGLNLSVPSVQQIPPTVYIAIMQFMQSCKLSSQTVNGSRSSDFSQCSSF